MTAHNAARGTLTSRGVTKRAQIVDTAARLFDEHGYHSVSMDDIAEAAGLAKATLYHYFTGKAQILYEIHRQFIFPLLKAERQRAGSGIPAAEELQLIIRDVIGFFAAKPGHMRVFSEHLRDLEPAHRTEVEAHREEYRQCIQGALQRGLDHGELWVPDTRIAALTLLGAMNWAYTWFRADGDLAAVDVADALWAQLLLGFAPREDPRASARGPAARREQP